MYILFLPRVGLYVNFLQINIIFTTGLDSKRLKDVILELYALYLLIGKIKLPFIDN
jgi:hypothetical protein